MTQTETILFPKREYTVIFSDGVYHGKKRFTGDDVLLDAAKDSTEVLTFRLRETVDNISDPLDITGLTVKFKATQYVTSLNKDLGIVPKSLDITATIVDAINGIVNVTLSSTNTNTPGLYYCHITLSVGGVERYNPLRFRMEIEDPDA